VSTTTKPTEQSVSGQSNNRNFRTWSRSHDKVDRQTKYWQL